MEAVKTVARLSLSHLLKGLPENGVGLQVARDTWHPLSGRFWEIVKVEPKKGSNEHLEAYGFFYFKGLRKNAEPKRIASVWKYGWMVRSTTSSGQRTEEHVVMAQGELEEDFKDQSRRDL
ncbi:hypothetical protein CEUSTIGMA_g6238.t1 [Chlamydomonas eustigma]|uniref:Uncharacterized protein n=1 Tax=Chlamydomonas eustigma TaxID=1157962 RepID=A0A250X6U3_9CHLO|nr:hypothetical protein CEUSTIGMA_g6238.t1 [Chlamydomonas eustigma]|eukprot:GAX78801.1 hypothetical protein CEUSTIGMA_g6238.t1 [Chlamydomonas eustigma]